MSAATAIEFRVIPIAPAFEINRAGDVRRRLPCRTSYVGRISSGGKCANLTQGDSVIVKTRRQLVEKTFGVAWPPNWAKGERVHCAKLKEQDVLEIRARREAGQSAKSLALEYGVCLSNIKQVISRHTWKHIG